MSKEIGVESDGDLFRMQQEAIKRARETAKLTHFDDKPLLNQETTAKPIKKKSFLFGDNNPFSSILKGFKTDDLLLLVVLFLLISEESDDDIILIILFLLFTGMK